LSQVASQPRRHAAVALNNDGATRSWLALGVAISCWTLSPLLIHDSSGLAPSPIVALFAVALGATFAAILLAGSKRLNILALIHANRAQQTLTKAAVIGGGTFIAYPLLYFSALQSAHSIVLVNLVNYMWPIIGVVFVASLRKQPLSLETILAVGFGFAGAAIAITTAHATARPGSSQFTPFLLAGLGALVYGGVSAYMRLYADETGTYHTQLLALSLLIAGSFSYIAVGILAVAHRAWITPHLTTQRVIPLLAYAALLPLAHLSWLRAVQDSRVPTFPAAYVIPVSGTAVLTLAVVGQASPAILSALVLVLCGIAFSSTSERTVPLRFAVTLGFLASIQVSQGLAGTVHGTADVQTGLLAQLLVALLAIFGGFVLTNAIRRHNTLQICCASFYAKVIGDKTGLSTQKRLRALDCLDEFVLANGRRNTYAAERHDSEGADLTTDLREVLTIGAAESTLPQPAQPTKDVLEARLLFPEEWAQVDVALTNKVSLYEWLVLLLGSSGLIFAGQFYAINSHSPAAIIVRAFMVAVTAGLIFAIRDYDKHRPGHVMTILIALRRGFGVEITSGSPLDEASKHGVARRVGPWEVIGLTVLVLSALVAIGLNIGS
jgi:drug/metabolite transporter (DMT)-like permease